MPDEMQIKINQFVVELCRLSHQLDEFSWRDHPEILTTAIEKGQAAYSDLLRRQPWLELSPKDAAMVESMMSTVKARLRFLRRWDGSLPMRTAVNS